VEDHALVRQGLRAILDGFSDLSVIGEATNGVEAVSMAADHMPDVVLMDINMPHMDGIEATRRIKAAQPETIVIGLSVNNVQHLQEAMREAGAGAFVSKDAAAEQLHDVITALIPQRLDRRAPGSIQAELPFS
jgi:DNA-binding NarL/FixJ family response regulator